MIIERNSYLNQLIAHRNNNMIKIITGLRKYYIQSAFSIDSEEKEYQEKLLLKNIPDSFKKIIIVKEIIIPKRDEYGITTIGIFDFLLNEESLDI